MGTFVNIQAALDTKLNTITGSPSIAWPNTEYTPTHGTLFLAPNVLPISSSLETLNDYHRYAGIYQVTIYTPVEKGTATMNLWIDRVHDLFDKQTLTSGGDSVLIQNIERGPVLRDTDNDIEYYRSDVDVYFIIYS